MSTPVTTATFDDTGGQVYVDPKLPTLIINQSATVTVTLSPTQGFDAIQSGQTVAGTQQVMLLQPLAAVTWSPGTPCYAKTPAGTTANITSVPGGMSYYGASSIISGGQVDVTVQNTPNVVVEGGTVDVGTMPDVTFTNSSIDVSGSVDANITNSSVTVDASGSTISLASGTSVDANITGPVTIETASGTPITANVQGSLTSITDPISVTGPITIEGTSGGTAVGVAGTIDANITNASITVETSGTTDVNVTNASIPVSGTVTVDIASGSSVGLAAGSATIGTVELASGSSVDASITGPVTIETASGTPITANVQGSLTSITDPISVTGPITIEGTSGGTAVGVAGTVDANITNASITVETSGTTDVNVTNATVPVSGSVTATVDGPVGISGGTINVIQPFTGETAASSVGATTTGNATLSTTDYNLVSWPAVPLPAGSPGNLVYDSNLQNAIAAVGPTWVNYMGTVGTANGDVNILNPGTDSAELVVYGTGAAQGGTFNSESFDLVVGQTYTLSAVIDATNATAGAPAIATASNGYTTIAAGSSGLVTHTFVATTSSDIVYPDVNNTTVTAGDTISWSHISLVEGPAPATYSPGPLWEYSVYGRGGLLGKTTALAFEDTGQTPNTDFQPPAVNTSYPQLASPSTPTVTPEGTTGSTTYDYQVTAKTAGSSVGSTRLAPSPGTKIGTIDIGPGNTVEIAAGTAQIGTVDIASGATIALNASSETIGTVDIASGASITLDASSETIGTVDIASGATIALSAGSETIALLRLSL